ncbi:RNase adapter RapZ [Salipaludibacillus neizhouensis]|uniref:RNase adapter RapZ n=1 Tax=Salipaludibacillus neizhouensis TaxID=885475 RepID=A0A3A9K5S9_9BACI|nr:RNase adapter RapZ [Salipaludibacillus neizhouensis]RKL68414.1 RNase adapter RapZ [Salipaludibacillus neizhouensis]
MENQGTDELELVIITGMSGAGKTVAVQSFEDMGYFCVDNLPPALIPKFIDLVEGSGGKMKKVALVIDLRGREFFDHLFESIDAIAGESKVTPQIVFLDAKDAALVRRYKETRRSHPLAEDGSPLQGIESERSILNDLKGQAQMIIDTTDLKPLELRERILQRFSSNSKESFSVQVLSFGFKHGIPIDADLVFDVRFLPNPHYIDHMRPQTGLDKVVSDYVLKWAETQQFIQKLDDLLQYMLPHYKREGKRQLVMAIGCTGGKHRSVTLAEYFKKRLNDLEYNSYVTHRDVEKGRLE